MTESRNAPVFMITADQFGRGAEELGHILMRGALKTLGKLPTPPQTVLFVNGGVKLCCPGSPVLADLQHLAEAGTRILCCGTCLDYYGLKEQLQVGTVSNMLEILSVAAAASRLVNL